jgi:H+/Cl- antiporter ClcA
VTGWAIDRVFPTGDGTAWSGAWWWIPLAAFGGLVVASLRSSWRVQEKVPGGVEIVEAAEIDHRSAGKWVAIATVSAIAGASLGPSFALAVMGGGLGSYLAHRRWHDDEADQDYTLTGIAGAFGGAFTSPILGAFLVSELEPVPRHKYVASIIPQLIASMVGFIIFFSVAGRTFLGSYDTPTYDFAVVDLLTAVGLGVLSAIVMVVLAVIVLAIRKVCALAPNGYVLGIVGGSIVGFIAFALPLTVGAGQTQLGVAIDGSAALGIGLLLVVLLAKMVAMSLSLEVGFLGGNVFPMIFIGGTAGVIVHLALPGVPIALTVSCMLAAVPGSYLRAPISMVLISAIALELDPETVAPVGAAVLTSYLIVAGIRYAISKRRPPVPA